MVMNPHLHIGSYNIRTLSNDDKMEELMHEVATIKRDVIDLCKLRRTGETCIKVQ